MVDLMEQLQDRRLIDCGLVSLRYCEPNEVVIEQDDRDRYLYAVQSGMVRVYGRVELEGRCRVRPGLSELGPGSVFGEFNLFAATPRSATVVAVEPTTLLQLDGSRLEACLQRHPELGFRLLRGLYQVLVSRLRQADRRIEGLFAWGLKAHGIEQHLRQA